MRALHGTGAMPPELVQDVLDLLVCSRDVSKCTVGKGRQLKDASDQEKSNLEAGKNAKKQTTSMKTLAQIFVERKKIISL